MKSFNFILAIAIAAVPVLTTPTGLAAQDDAAQGKKAQHQHYKFVGWARSAGRRVIFRTDAPFGFFSLSGSKNRPAQPKPG